MISAKPVPDNIIWESNFGYAVNVPFVDLGDPYWWEDRPEVVASIKRLRRKLGIKINDFPNGVPPRPDETWT